MVLDTCTFFYYASVDDVNAWIRSGRQISFPYRAEVRKVNDGICMVRENLGIEVHLARVYVCVKKMDSS